MGGGEDAFISGRDEEQVNVAYGVGGGGRVVGADKV